MNTLTLNQQPVSSGFRVDVSRGERIGRVSSEWFSRPDDERYLNLTELYDTSPATSPCSAATEARIVGRLDIFRALAIVVLIGVFIATLFAINRRPATPAAPDFQTTSSPDDLSAELRRCRALGPQDAEDPRCQAVWEENRRRFLGRSARPLPPAAAPANPTPGDAR
jgi:conjugative transfer region protein TrbK